MINKIIYYNMCKATFTFATEEFLKPQVINCILSNILKFSHYNLLDIIVNTHNVIYKYDTLDINVLYVDNKCQHDIMLI